MSNNKATDERLIGRWSLFMSHDKMIAGEVLTMTFTLAGDLISIIYDDDETHEFKHKFTVSGDEIAITDPPKPSMASLVREKFCFDEAGNLLIESNGMKSWFRRV